jgi:hypothetical protein
MNCHQNMTFPEFARLHPSGRSNTITGNLCLTLGPRFFLGLVGEIAEKQADGILETLHKSVNNSR